MLEIKKEYGEVTFLEGVTTIQDEDVLSYESMMSIVAYVTKRLIRVAKPYQGQLLTEDLKSTLEFGTGLGIAAPQIGINKRIIVVGAKKENIKYNDAEEVPITAMINPCWRKISEETDIQYEGCMSVPSIRGKVERYKNIELTYYNENGEKIIKELNGFFARLIQHECDHLDGIVFLEKVKEKNAFATQENINKYNLRNI